MSPSRSARAPCWRACAPCCVARGWSGRERSTRGTCPWTWRDRRCACAAAQLLLANGGHALPLERLTSHVWGYRGLGDRQLLKQLVHRLRRKIETDPASPRYLVTVSGVGYALYPSMERD
ncbi:MAG: hypothetical protein DMF51_15020 [Acidobacteria bacterium]|nr:MAG: hypothetical protein DMF51_15020 [Acidobacteriota bacterium]